MSQSRSCGLLPRLSTVNNGMAVLGWSLAQDSDLYLYPCLTLRTVVHPRPLLYTWFSSRRGCYPRPGAYAHVTWCPRYSNPCRGSTNFAGQGILFRLPCGSTNPLEPMNSPHKSELFNVRFALFCHLRLEFCSLREFAVGLSSRPAVVKIFFAHGIEHRAKFRYDSSQRP